MKKLALVVLILAVSVFFTAIVMAESPAPAGQPPLPGVEHGETFVALPYPDLSGVELPQHLDLPAAQDLARSLQAEQAAPIEAELQRLRSNGALREFRLRYESYGAVVTADAPVATSLSSLPGVAGVARTGQAVPQCATQAGDALVRELVARSAAQNLAASAAPEGTNPSIALYLPPSGVTSGGWFSSITGKTDPNVLVKAEIIRNGKTVATPQTTSNSSGSYYLYPSYQSCPNEGYDWTLKSGDTVRVTAGSKVATAVAALVDPVADPTANTVSGLTLPSRAVRVYVYRSSSAGDLCDFQQSSYTTQSDASGRYSVNTADFDRAAWVDVQSLDANGNYSGYSVDAYHLYCATTWGYCGFEMHPSEDLDVTIVRAGQSGGETYHGRTDATGRFGAYLSGGPLQAGDRVSAISKSHRIDFTAAAWSNSQLDPDADRLTGNTAWGRRVKVYFERDYDTSTMSVCNDWTYCATATADVGGSVAVQSPADVLRGDYAYPYIYDEDGNYQYYQRSPAAAIYARLSWGEILGIWKRVSSWVNVKLSNEMGSPLAFLSGLSVDGDGRFYAFLSDIKPGYKIEVSDGQSTEVMTVQDVTARLENNPPRMSGSAASGQLLSYVWDYRPENGYYYGYCMEKAHSGGQYSFAQSDWKIGASDQGLVRLRGPDGHYTERYAHAFSVSLYKDGSSLWGYTETPNTNTTLQVKRGGSTIYNESSPSYSDAYFSYYAVSPLQFTQGDQVLLTTGDGDAASITVPPLSVSINRTARTVEGTAPPQSSVYAEARRTYSYSSYYSYGKTVRAGADGRFSASFAGNYWSRDCSPVDLANPCMQAAVTYFAPGDHRVIKETERPKPVDADAFEPDNDRSRASEYTGRQSHTFHDHEDEDWVLFTIPQNQIDRGVTVRISAPYLGWGTGLDIQLWDFLGSMVGEWWDSDSSGNWSVLWTPLEAGPYYLRVRPADYDSAGYCDSRYDLTVSAITDRVHLPTILR